MSAQTGQNSVAWIGLGSNRGDSSALLRLAAGSLLGLPGSELVAASHLYRTAPVGEGFSGDFFNAVLGLRTRLSPGELLARCQRIEAELGRDRETSPDRTADLDILLFGDLVVSEPGLEIPHPRLAERRFVLEPLAEVAPEQIHPVSGKTIGELLSSLEEKQRTERLEAKLL